MKNSETFPETNARIIDFEVSGRKKAAKRWLSLSGAKQMAFYNNLWAKDKEIVSEFLKTPEGAGTNVPKLHLHPKRHGRLFASIYYMENDVKLAFVEYVISRFGYEILSGEYTG